MGATLLPDRTLTGKLLRRKNIDWHPWIFRPPLRPESSPATAQVSFHECRTGGDVVWMTPAGVIATMAGWVTSESGRQPYVIYGLLRTDEAASSLSNFPVIFSFGLFLIVYAILLIAYILFVRKIVRKGPEFFHETSKTEGHKEDNFISGLPKSIKITGN